MKFKFLLSGLLAAAAVLTGCSEESSTPSIKAVALDISKDAGEYNLPYSIQNGSGSGQLTATTEADWIYDIRVESYKVCRAEYRGCAYSIDAFVLPWSGRCIRQD